MLLGPYREQAVVVLRPYQAEDAATLLELFRDTVRQVNSADYSPIQIRAWASDEIALADWSKRFEGRLAYVAEINSLPVGFSDMTSHGHIDRFFVSSNHQRCGIGRVLLTRLIHDAQQLGLPSMTADVSITARPFFEAHRFRVLTQQTVQSRGVDFTNFRMERTFGEATA